jgi:hypothetical protein
MKRWYDTHSIGKHLDLFKTMSKKERDPIVSGILQILKSDGNSLIDSNVMDFPLEETHRRWYDNDPSLWMVFHGLEKAEKKLIDEVAAYLKNAIK